MLSVKANEELTQVGAGTPMGELMRRYWHPVAATAELGERPTKPVRLLGEDLVLYRDSPARSDSSNASAPTAGSTSPTASPRSTASAACITAG